MKAGISSGDRKKIITGFSSDPRLTAAALTSIPWECFKATAGKRAAVGICNGSLNVRIADAGDRQLDRDVINSLGEFIAAAPAANIVLRMLLAGVASFEPSTKEFRFGGLRYSCRHGDWDRLMAVVGWKNALDAIEQHGG